MYETFIVRYIAVRRIIRWIYDSLPLMTNDNKISLWEERIRIYSFMDCVIHHSRLKLSIVHCIFSDVRAHAKLIRNTGKCQSELIFSWDEVICTGSHAVCSSCEPSYILPGDVFQFGRRYCLCYFIWISLLLLPLPLSPFLSLLPAFSWEMWIPRKIVRGLCRGWGWYTRGTEAFSSVRHFIP